MVRKNPVALIGNALLSLTEDLESQIRTHGNMIAVTLGQVQEAEQGLDSAAVLMAW